MSQTTPDQHTPALSPAPLPASAEGPAKAPASRRKKAIGLFLGTAAAVATGFILWELLVGRFSESTDNAYVAGDQVMVSAQLAGNIRRIAVDDNQTVQAGQLLIELDDTDTRVGLENAQARLADTVRQVRALFDQVDVSKASTRAKEADIDKATEDVRKASAELSRTQSDLARRETAFKQGAVSAEELEHARTLQTQAQAQLAGAKAVLSQAQAGLTQAQANLAASLNQTRNVQVASHPRVREAMAQLSAAWVQQQRTRIEAPVAGQVSRRSAQPGMRLAPGTPLLTLVPLNAVWVDANFKESQLANIRNGQAVKLSADVYGSGVTFRGTVTGLSAGTGSAFSLLPAQNATGNWIKVVQRVPVRIQLNTEDLLKAPLRVGLSMHAEVDTHASNGEPVFTSPTAARQTAMFDSLAAQAEAFAQESLKRELGAP